MCRVKIPCPVLPLAPPQSNRIGTQAEELRPARRFWLAVNCHSSRGVRKQFPKARSRPDVLRSAGCKMAREFYIHFDPFRSGPRTGIKDRNLRDFASFHAASDRL